MIRGERNYLKGIELKIAIGLQLTENEALIISGPQSAIARQSISYVVLAPGDSDKSRIANRIAKMFNERLKSLGFASINIRADDVIRVIPPGTAKIISKGEGHISAFSENHLER